MAQQGVEQLGSRGEYESERETEYAFRFSAESFVDGANKLPGETTLDAMVRFATPRSMESSLEKIIDYTAEAWARRRLHLTSWTTQHILKGKEIPEDKKPQFDVLTRAYGDMIRAQFSERGTFDIGMGERLPYSRPSEPFIRGSM